jgi:hypothetical protein
MTLATVVLITRDSSYHRFSLEFSRLNAMLHNLGYTAWRAGTTRFDPLSS